MKDVREKLGKRQYFTGENRCLWSQTHHHEKLTCCDYRESTGEGSRLGPESQGSRQYPCVEVYEPTNTSVLET